MRVTLMIRNQSISIIEAPSDAVIEVWDYDAPDDWAGVETDPDGDTFQRVTLLPDGYVGTSQSERL